MQQRGAIPFAHIGITFDPGGGLIGPLQQRRGEGRSQNPRTVQFHRLRVDDPRPVRAFTLPNRIGFGSQRCDVKQTARQRAFGIDDDLQTPEGRLDSRSAGRFAHACLHARIGTGRRHSRRAQLLGRNGSLHARAGAFQENVAGAVGIVIFDDDVVPAIGKFGRGFGIFVLQFDAFDPDGVGDHVLVGIVGKLHRERIFGDSNPIADRLPADAGVVKIRWRRLLVDVNGGDRFAVFDDRVRRVGGAIEKCHPRHGDAIIARKQAIKTPRRGARTFSGRNIMEDALITLPRRRRDRPVSGGRKSLLSIVNDLDVPAIDELLLVDRQPHSIARVERVTSALRNEKLAAPAYGRPLAPGIGQLVVLDAQLRIDRAADQRLKTGAFKILRQQPREDRAFGRPSNGPEQHRKNPRLLLRRVARALLQLAGFGVTLRSGQRFVKIFQFAIGRRKQFGDGVQAGLDRRLVGRSRARGAALERAHGVIGKALQALGKFLHHAAQRAGLGLRHAVFKRQRCAVNFTRGSVERLGEEQPVGRLKIDILGTEDLREIRVVLFSSAEQFARGRQRFLCVIQFGEQQIAVDLLSGRDVQAAFFTTLRRRRCCRRLRRDR